LQAPLWHFEQLGTLRRKLIQRAGRLTKPQGVLTLTMSANPAIKSEKILLPNQTAKPPLLSHLTQEYSKLTSQYV
jgi:hypothetical protein